MALLQELKARKAKYGFKQDYISLETFIPLGKLLESLQNTWADTEYSTEMVGMHSNQFRLYTNNDNVAKWVRDTWCVDTF
jgi:hypothetical protein